MSADFFQKVWNVPYACVHLQIVTFQNVYGSYIVDTKFHVFCVLPP